MRTAKFVLTFVAVVSLVVVLNQRIDILPPLGKFLDPFHGFWQNAETGDLPRQVELTVDGLQAPVTILYDDRQIPHIFAQNDHDLYFAQGYVTARDRLWQMEFQTRAAAGRLSEVIGPVTLEYDRFQRRIGMKYGAENTHTATEADATMRTIVNAYTEGINNYIRTLEPETYPVEYKLFDHAPEKWTPLKCALLLKYMAWMLTGRSSDLQMSNTLARFGPEVVADLFPHYPPNMKPIIPEGTRWDFQPVQVQKPDGAFKAKTANDLPPIEPHPSNGSNNWAVAGEKTASGYPLLANDPHLNLNLPSIWYELQLVSPTVNVYGVSLPGAPNVIIGFNQQIAWGVTNSEADVMDWYEIKFKDNQLTEYWYDNQWRPTHRVVEEINVRGQETVLDTVTYTHHGPVVLRPGEKPFSRQTPVLHAVRWLGHDAGEEARAFYQLNRAQNYEDYVAALAWYSCPAQNFVFADTSNNIAIWHNGKFPAKWPQQGKFIGDGTDPRYDWQGWIPHEHNPHIRNPQRGFVSSANQNPTDPPYPYYLNWYFAPYYRGARINEWLELSHNMEPEDFRIMQLDSKNLHAESVLPTLLRMLDQEGLSQAERVARNELAKWDYFSDAGKIAPTIFDVWWKKLYNAIWKDEFGQGYMRWPHKDRTVRLIVEEPESKWFDNTHTDKLETAADLVVTTFKAAHAELVETLGYLDGSDSRSDNGSGKGLNARWRWGKFKGTDVLHLARIPGFGRMNLDVGGDRGIINATGRRHGPSWRMVVALGPEVEGWGIYPGGQSGNPGSKHYDDFIEPWTKGELAELLFLRSQDDANERIVSRCVLRGK